MWHDRLNNSIIVASLAVVVERCFMRAIFRLKIKIAAYNFIKRRGFLMWILVVLFINNNTQQRNRLLFNNSRIITLYCIGTNHGAFELMILILVSMFSGGNLIFHGEMMMEIDYRRILNYLCVADKFCSKNESRSLQTFRHHAVLWAPGGIVGQQISLECVLWKRYNDYKLRRVDQDEFESFQSQRLKFLIIYPQKSIRF